MRLAYTLIFTLIGLALCLFNATGYDPHNAFLFMFSVPIWFVELFGDIHRVSVMAMYALTVLSYVAIGAICDSLIARLYRKRRA